MHEGALHAARKWTPYATTAAPHAQRRATAVRATRGTPSQRRVAIRMARPPMAPAGRPGAGSADSHRPAPAPWQAASRARSALSGSEACSPPSAAKCTGPARSRWDGARAPPSSRAQLSRVPPATRSRPFAAIWASAGGARRSGAVGGGAGAAPHAAFKAATAARTLERIGGRRPDGVASAAGGAPAAPAAAAAPARGAPGHAQVSTWAPAGAAETTGSVSRRASARSANAGAAARWQFTAASA